MKRFMIIGCLIILCVLLCGCASPTPVLGTVVINPTPTPIPEPARNWGVHNAVIDAKNYILLHSPHPVDNNVLIIDDVDTGLWCIYPSGYASSGIAFVDVTFQFTSGGIPMHAESIVILNNGISISYADVNGEMI